MQVILMEKVGKLGNLGDVVKVKDGYARNFLIPQGKAKRATDANLKEFEQKRSVLEKAQADILTKAQERGTKLDGFMLQITQKAGVDGRLFGSVTNYDIVEALKKQGHDVAVGVPVHRERSGRLGGRARVVARELRRVAPQDLLEHETFYSRVEKFSCVRAFAVHRQSTGYAQFAHRPAA